MKNWKKALALLLAGGVLLVGCSQQPASTSTQATATAAGTTAETTAAGIEPSAPNLQGVNNELTMRIEGNVDSAKVLTTFVEADSTAAFNGNPFDETSGMTWSPRALVFDRLAYYTPLPEPSYKLSMLDSYTYEDKVLTLKLKSGLEWSDGSTLDAEDVMTYFWCQVGRNSAWYYLESMEKVDDTTIQMTFVNESPLLLTLVLNSNITTPNEIYGEWAAEYKEVAENMRSYDEAGMIYSYTDEGSEKIAEINLSLLDYKPDVTETIYNGPYVIARNTSAEIIFETNEHFRSTPLIPTIRGLRGGDSQAFATSILAAEFTVENGGVNVDMANQIDLQFEETLRKVYVPELSQIGYTINTQVYPLDQLEVRQAISMALNREALVAVSEPGSFSGSVYNAGLLPSMTSAYADEAFLSTLTNYDYNPDEAARLLESIGWTKQGNMWVDPNGESPVISIATISSWPTFMMTGEAISQMLTDFGFNVDFQPMEFGMWNDFSKTDEKMLLCAFIGGAATYAHPWECFNDLYNASTRTGWQKFETGEDKIFTTADGTEYNTTQMLRALYTASDEAEIREITQQFMKLSNDLCGYISVVEKAAPLRIYDTSLSLPEVNEEGGIAVDATYFGNLNDIVVKMILDDALYFVEK